MHATAVTASKACPLVSSACVQWPAVTTVARIPFRIHSTFRSCFIVAKIAPCDCLFKCAVYKYTYILTYKTDACVCVCLCVSVVYVCKFVVCMMKYLYLFLTLSLLIPASPIFSRDISVHAGCLESKGQMSRLTDGRQMSTVDVDRF